MSAACHGHLRERLPAVPESIQPLRRAVVDLAAGCGAPQHQLENIALAVSEAVSNAVMHAYIDDERPGAVAVEARVRDDAIDVTVCDEGRGLRPRDDSPGLGWGLALIDHIAEQLRLDESGPGVKLQMRFPIR